MKAMKVVSFNENVCYNPVLNTYRKAKWLNLPVCGNFSHFCFLRFVVRKPYPEIFLIFLFSSFGW